MTVELLGACDDDVIKVCVCVAVTVELLGACDDAVTSGTERMT